VPQEWQYRANLVSLAGEEIEGALLVAGWERTKIGFVYKGIEIWNAHNWNEGYKGVCLWRGGIYIGCCHLPPLLPGESDIQALTVAWIVTSFVISGWG